MINNQRGFTLFELAVVLAILSILATLAVPNFMDEYNERRAALTIQETQMIMDAARAFRGDTGNWPGAPNCTNALTILRAGGSPYLGGSGNTNRYNSNYTTACNANSFSVTQAIIPDFDGVIANGLPGTLISQPSTNTITSIVGVPGSESALATKLSRIATGNAEDNRMRTNLLLGNNNISEVNNLNANRVNAQTVDATGNIRATGQIQASSAVISGGASVDGRVLTREFEISGRATEGASCPRAGVMSSTTAGLALTCQRGRWTRSSNWFDSPVSGGSGCTGTAGRGSFAIGTDGKLYVCR